MTKRSLLSPLVTSGLDRPAMRLRIREEEEEEVEGAGRGRGGSEICLFEVYSGESLAFIQSGKAIPRVRGARGKKQRRLDHPLHVTMIAYDDDNTVYCVYL